MTKSLLLIRASTLTGLRWAKEHVYSWLILGPVVLGISYFTAIRLAENLPDWEPSPLLGIATVTFFEMGLVALCLSRSSAEIYHLRRPESYFDSLPIPLSSHLHSAFATRAAKTGMIAIGAVIARLTFTKTEPFQPLDLLLILCFVGLTSLCEALASLNWIHWGHRRITRVAISALLAVMLTSMLAGLMLAVVLNPGYLALTLRWWLLPVGVIWMASLYLITSSLHQRWRSFDIEYAKRLQSTSRVRELMPRVLRRRLPAVVAAQLARDLKLTLRAFSTAVYVVFAVAALWALALTVTLATNFLPDVSFDSGWLDATWLPHAIAVKIACVLAVISLASLLPLLIAYELPLMWLERSVGTTGLDIWRSKLWYARMVTIPAPWVVWLAGVITGKIPGFYVLPLLLECLWLWWLVSTVMGALSFEMPTRPDLAIIVAGTLGFAMGLLASLLWPVGLIAYPQAMHSLTDRGRTRTRYYLITEDE